MCRAAVFPKVDSPLRARGLMAPPVLSALGAINPHARKGESTFGNTIQRRNCHYSP